MKKIYFLGIFPRMYSATQLLIDYPPKGYTFILPQAKVKTTTLKFMLESKVIKFFYRNLLKKMFDTSEWYSKACYVSAPDDADLVIPCHGQFNLEKPFIILIVDTPLSLSSYKYDKFLREKEILQKKLLSPLCKRIIVFNESSIKEMKKYFSKEVLKKTILVRAAVLNPNFKKDYNHKNIKITFMGSTGNPDDFYIKGGLEAIESFKRVSEEFNNIQLIVRCKVPEEVKQKYKHVKNLTILEDSLTYSEWSRILKETDICLNPGHVYPLMATLESLSFGTPIIMLDTWGVRDYLTNKNSILIKPSEKIQGYKAKDYPLNIRTNEFIEEIKKLDDRVINDICSALRRLIKNPKLREKLGKNGRYDAETKFSIETRNQKLKKIFDQALKN